MNINELLARYNISSRRTLYSRLEAVNISLQKDYEGKAYATEEQLKVLDDLDKHLKTGGTLKNFTPTTEVVVQSLQLNEETEIISSNLNEFTQMEKFMFEVFDKLPERFNLLGEAIADRIKPYSQEEALLWYAQEQILISSSKVRSLINVSPSGKEFFRGSFKFIRTGKLGRESAWKIEKI